MSMSFSSSGTVCASFSHPWWRWWWWWCWSSHPFWMNLASSAALKQQLLSKQCLHILYAKPKMKQKKMPYCPCALCSRLCFPFTRKEDKGRRKFLSITLPMHAAGYYFPFSWVLVVSPQVRHCFCLCKFQCAHVWSHRNWNGTFAVRQRMHVYHCMTDADWRDAHR